MVLLVAKFNKLYSKLENFHHHHHHHHHHHGPLSASLEVFLCDVSNCLSKFSSSSSSLSSKTTSFSWIHECFEIIPATHKAFSKLVVAMDHPMSKWEASSVEEYLNYTFNLLELFNSITSSISHLGHAKLSLSHGLSTLALKHLKPIEPLVEFNKELRRERAREEEEEEGKGGSCSSKEEVIHKAVMVMKSLGFWVCWVVLSSLCGGRNPKACDEMRNFGGGFVKASFGGLDSCVFEAIAEKKDEIKEVKEVNDSVASLVAAIVENGKRSGEAAEELRRRLEVLEKVLDGFGNEVGGLFKEVLSGRNQLLNGFQRRKE